MKAVLKINRIVWVAAFILFCFGLPAAARADGLKEAVAVFAQQSPVMETPSGHGYIEANQWYRFASTPEKTVGLYYEYRTKPNTCYYVSLYIELAENYKSSMKASGMLGKFDPTRIGDDSDGFYDTSEDGKYLNSNSKLRSISWKLYKPGEKIMVRVRQLPGIRFYLYVQEDEYGTGLDSVPSTASFRRGDVIKGAFARNDKDYIRFRSDANSLYRVRIQAEIPEENPREELFNDPTAPGLTLYENKTETKAEFAPMTLLSTTFDNMIFGKGIQCADGSTAFYLLLNPNTDYIWEISGSEYRYELSFDPVNLETMKSETGWTMTCIDDPAKDLEFTGGAFYYNGKPVEPKVRIRSNPTVNYRIVIGEDNYELSYRNNNVPGTGYAIVKGVGNVSGTLEVPFTIISHDKSSDSGSGSDKDSGTSAPKKGAKLTDTKNNAKVTVTDPGTAVAYAGPVKAAATVKIPDTVTAGGITYKVTSIANNAFAGNKKLKKVTIGKYVTVIGDKAFYNCKKLTKVTIPATVNRIGKSAFQGCKKLKTIAIKSTLLNTASVGGNAFKGTYKKAKVTVPKAVKSEYKKWLKKKGLNKKAKIK